jgi:hypothetical protein
VNRGLVWNGNGKEIFYVAPDRKLVPVAVSDGKVQDDVDWRIRVFTRFSEHKEPLAIFRRRIVISSVTQISDRCSKQR